MRYTFGAICAYGTRKVRNVALPIPEKRIYNKKQVCDGIIYAVADLILLIY